jgi:glutaminyl-peptide cyclotransferase
VLDAHARARQGRPPIRWLHGAVLWLLLAGAAVAAPAPEIAWRLVGSHPHDNAAFTQGLVWHDGALFESTGLYGHSQLRRVDPRSGRVLARRRLAADLFGEGLALAGAHLYQLTWRSGRGFVYRASDLEPVREFRYRGEGWGLAFDGRRLFMSDGSATLRVVEPEGFREVAQLRVHDDGAPVPLLNELEFAEGHLYANVWRSDRIARIDPKSGRVTGWLDLSGLLSPLWSASVDVLNGIAWDFAQRRLWVTGKLWPRIFVLEIVDDAAAPGHAPAAAAPGPVR